MRHRSLTQRLLELATCFPEIAGALLIVSDQHGLIGEAIAHRGGMRAEALTREHAGVARRNLDEALRDLEQVAKPGGCTVDASVTVTRPAPSLLSY